MDRARGDLGIERGRLELAVPEQHLNDADVDVLLEQMSGKGVTCWTDGAPLKL